MFAGRKARKLGIIDCGLRKGFHPPDKPYDVYRVSAHSLCRRPMRVFRTESGEVGTWCENCMVICSRGHLGLNSSAQVDNLLSVTASKNADELVSYALSLLDLCVKEVQRGRIIASVEEGTREGKPVVLAYNPIELPLQKMPVAPS